MGNRRTSHVLKGRRKGEYQMKTEWLISRTLGKIGEEKTVVHLFTKFLSGGGVAGKGGPGSHLGNRCPRKFGNR